MKRKGKKSTATGATCMAPTLTSLLAANCPQQVVSLQFSIPCHLLSAWMLNVLGTGLSGLCVNFWSSVCEPGSPPGALEVAVIKIRINLPFSRSSVAFVAIWKSRQHINVGKCHLRAFTSPVLTVVS